MSACRHPASHYHRTIHVPSTYYPITITLHDHLPLIYQPHPIDIPSHSYTTAQPGCVHAVYLRGRFQRARSFAKEKLASRSLSGDRGIQLLTIGIHLDRGSFNKVVRVGRLQHDLASFILSAAVALAIINELNEGNAFVRSRLLVTLSLSSPQRHSRRPFSSTSRSLCSTAATRNVSVSWVHEHESRGNTVDTPHASDRFTHD